MFLAFLVFFVGFPFKTAKNTETHLRLELRPHRVEKGWRGVWDLKFGSFGALVTSETICSRPHDSTWLLNFPHCVHKDNTFSFLSCIKYQFDGEEIRKTQQKNILGHQSILLRIKFGVGIGFGLGGWVNCPLLCCVSYCCLHYFCCCCFASIFIVCPSFTCLPYLWV